MDRSYASPLFLFGFVIPLFLQQVALAFVVSVAPFTITCAALPYVFSSVEDQAGVFFCPFMAVFASDSG